MIRVLIVDDQELFRESLKVVLGVGREIEVTGAVPTVADALESIARRMPDVALMDVRMPGTDGVEGTRIIKDRWPGIRVIVLTTFEDDAYVFGALKYGASGYLLKGSSVSELSDAIRTACGGGAVLDPGVTGKVVEQFSRMARNVPEVRPEERAAEGISRSEWPIVRAVGRGLSNREIARELCLSEGTVRNALSSVLSKLGLRDRTQLAIWAVRTGEADRP